MEVPTPSPANTGCQLYVPPSAVACGSRSPVEETEERVGRPGAGEGAWAAELQEGSAGARHRGLGGFRDSWIQELGQSWALKAEQSSPGKEPPGAAEGECGCGTCQHLGPQRLVGLTEQRGSGTRCPTAPSAPSPPAGQPLAGNRRWRGAGGRPPQGGLSSSGQDTRHFLTRPRSPGRGGHRGGGIPAGIPTPPPQFVHFLPWLQISTISLSGHLQPLPLPGPELTLAGDRTVLVLPAPS